MPIRRPSKALTLIVSLPVLGATLAYLWTQDSFTIESLNQSSQSCASVREYFTVEDSWLLGLVKPNQVVTVIKDWQSCRELKRGDVVLYQMSQDSGPVLRVLAATPGDRFEVVPASNGKGRSIKINDEFYGTKNQSYSFEGEVLPEKGVLSKTEILLLSTVSPGNQDSATLGPLSLNNILGIMVQEN